MGTNHGGNSGDLPPEGDRPPDPELPELPPEWGQLAVPDDPSELAGEAEQIREELAEEQRTGRPHRPAEQAAAGTESSVGTPLLIMSVAVVITLVSLFAMAWSGSGSSTGGDPGGAGTPAELPPITLSDHLGRQVALTGQAPVAVLLVEECSCQNLVSATVAAAPSGVRVAAVGQSPPPSPAGVTPEDQPPLRLGDPSGLVRSQLDLDPPTDAATVVLVDGDGQITRTYPTATSVAQFQGELTNL